MRPRSGPNSRLGPGEAQLGRLPVPARLQDARRPRRRFRPRHRDRRRAVGMGRTGRRTMRTRGRACRLDPAGLEAVRSPAASDVHSVCADAAGRPAVGPGAAGATFRPRRGTAHERQGRLQQLAALDPVPARHHSSRRGRDRAGPSPFRQLVLRRSRQRAARAPPATPPSPPNSPARRLSHCAAWNPGAGILWTRCAPSSPTGIRPIHCYMF